MISTTANKHVLAIVAWGYVVLGIFLAMTYIFAGEAYRSIISYSMVGILAPAAWTAHRYLRFPRLFVVGLAGAAVMYVVVAGAAAAFGDSGPVIEDVFDIIGNAMVIALLAMLVKRRRGGFTAGDILDGILIAIGAWIVAWIGLVQPFINDSEQSAFRLVLNALYLPMAVPLLALSMIFLFAGRSRCPANWFVVTTIWLNIAGDLVYALGGARGIGSWLYVCADVLYILTFATAAAAVSHPTSAELFDRTRIVRHRLDLPGRLGLTTVSLVVPVLVVALVAAESTLDRVVRVVSTAGLLLLVAGRLYHATSRALSSQSQLVEAARTDPLTELPNKIALLDAAEESINDVWRTERQPALYLFDLDRFKNINDSLGHSTGDEVLHLIAHRLKLGAESLGAMVGRPSGDEFLVFDPTPNSLSEAIAHAESLLTIFNEPLQIDHAALFVTASVGVAVMPAGRPLSGEELFRWADIAMYRAKDAGRNCLALYDSSMQDRIKLRMRIETELHGALERREFRLFHQPIVDVRSGRVSGFEALIRWQKPDGTMASPAEFIPVAEDTGLISSIGSWAILEALTQLRTWTDDGIVPEGTTVSVNVSPKQLADPHFTDTVAEALSRAGIAPHLLWLEVTESMMIEDPDLARTTLERIRSLGARIALDDFGTGFSSLSLLRQFPLQRIKIDRSFVSGITNNVNDCSLVRTIIGLGNSLGLDIVAEGVETVQQLKVLRELGCAKAQGFLISHPVPAEAMRSTVAALESMSRWPEFGQILGDSPLARPRRF